MITVKGRGKLAEGTAAPGQPVAISTQVALNDLDPDFDRRPLDPPPPVDPVRLSGEQVTFDLSGFDATSGIAGFHWRLKNPNASVTDWVNQIAPVVTLRIEIQTEGIYELEVQSEDAAGHLSESSRTAFVIDRTAPTAVLESAAVVTDPNYELIYTIDDAIDGSRQLSEQLVLALGVNLFTRVVTDAAGNNRVAIFSISLE